MAAIPYSSIPDSLVKVEGSEIKSLYNQRKEQYKQYNEARNIRYIDVEVIPSDADKETLKKEVEELTSQLNQADMDYSALYAQLDQMCCMKIYTSQRGLSFRCYSSFRFCKCGFCFWTLF